MFRPLKIRARHIVRHVRHSIRKSADATTVRVKYPYAISLRPQDFVGDNLPGHMPEIVLRNRTTTTVRHTRPIRPRRSSSRVHAPIVRPTFGRARVPLRPCTRRGRLRFDGRNLLECLFVLLRSFFELRRRLRTKKTSRHGSDTIDGRIGGVRQKTYYESVH